MTLKFTVFAVLLTLNVVKAAETIQTGLYTIVGSQQISIHRPYSVSVSVHNTSEPAVIRLKLNNDITEISKEITVEPWSTELITFETDTFASQPNAHFRLIADGISGIDFHNETDITLSNKYFSFLPQTDKALYKPGDLVRFRVLVIDKDTNAYDLAGSLQVSVYDGSGNKVKLFSNQSTTNGVYKNEFQLSDLPVYGTWRLTFNTENEEKSHSFEVGEYVLPTFEVFIEAPEHVLYKDQVIQANIRGKYTFGKPVHGEANCTIGWNGKKVNKLVKVTTKGSLEIDFVSELQVDYDNYNHIQLDVTLEEEFTGRKQSKSMGIQIHRFRYSIVKQTYTYQYLDGQPFEFEVRVQLYDGTPIRNEPVEIWWTTDISSKDEIGSKIVKTNNEGVAKVDFTFPENKVNVYLMAKYKDHAEGLGHYTSSIYHGTKAHIPEFELKSNNSDVAVGDTIKMQVTSRDPLKHLTYQVFARGNVLLSKTQNVDDQNDIEFDFEATFDMVPNAKIVAYAIHDDGSVNVASHMIYLQKKLPNKITLETSLNETEPGKEYDLKVITSPKSYVGLLAVDQSVILLRSGNDLSLDDVTNELDRYNQYSRNNYYNRYQWSQHISTIENSGMFILSNVPDFIPKPIEIYYTTSLRPYAKLGIGASGAAGFAAAAPPQQALEHVAFDQSVRFGGSSVSNVAIRKDFSETWMWNEIEVENGEEHFKKRVPDTITSWVITAFSMNAENGLGLTAEPSKITTFKVFFVSVSLPYSVKRGEILSIPVTVFNYFNQTVNADVTFFNNDKEFEFVDLDDEANEIANANEQRQKSISVKSKDTSGLFFLIRPLKIGQITIKVTVESPMAGDGVQNILRVTPEGVPQYGNKALLLNIPAGETIENEFTVDLPEHTVPDSTYIEVSAIGDLLGSTVKNLNQLIHMPSGCGEQNMLKFVPNIVVRNYLKAINQLNADLEEKTRLNMEIGYQRQLTYRHHNGSFSAFGREDRRGSTWLTAFVARSFRQAADHIEIEPRIIEEALKFLSTIQTENGSFPEFGQVIHRYMQGGADQGVALTAYTLITFLENRKAFPIYEANIERAISYIVKNLNTLDDVYSMSLAAYALQLANDPNKDSVLKNLNAKSIVESDRKHWSINPDHIGNSIDTEITGYAMLAQFHAGQTDDIVPILKWLLSQRNERGGFRSTQDTIVGLQAIASVAGKLTTESTSNRDVKVDLSYDKDSTSVTVDQDNAQVLQQIQLPNSVRKVGVKASGSGFTLLSLSYKYYVNETAAKPRFTIQANVLPTEYLNSLELQVCVSFIPNENVEESNMAVMEIDFPSGYQFDSDHRKSLESSEVVKKVETKNDDTRIVLYYERLTKEETCSMLKAIRTHKVAHQKPAAILVYDYYDTTRKSRVFYNTNEKSLCDICENNCPEKCRA